eukprot:m.170110 g.170110  ORF g.170110 m.170110 type:complete len:888 (-) comp14518_c0_seq1:2552-5215(-)
MAPRKLRDLIRAVRECKTAAEERELIQRESSDIRATLRQEKAEFLSRSVAKLIYIGMLGYPTHFGQVACLNLVCTPNFANKRIGYLATMLLLDEGKELHLMVTNSIKQDMSNDNPYIAGLALSTLGTIASLDMARDLSFEVEKLLRSSNPYIRKKAALCAIRMIRKDSELVETFVPATRSILTEKHHGVLVTGVALIEEMCVQQTSSLQHFRRLVPSLTRLLKSLLASGFSAEHDVNGVTDPFLQCAVLRLLRVLGRGDDEASEAMNDILAEVATNTLISSAAGNAVLYEAVMCILDINAESGLRVLAINNLGKFLLSTDRNIRSVALSMLLTTVHKGGNTSDAVQRHRATIIDCLRESDITIRKRALTLCFALINESNIRSLFEELLSFLEVADTSFKDYMVTELLLAAARFAPSRKWHVDTAIAIITAAGPHVQEAGIAEIVHILADNAEFHQTTVQAMYIALLRKPKAQPLLQVAVWCVGEFCDQLIAGGALDIGGTKSDVVPNSDSVVRLLKGLLHDTSNSPTTRHYALNALMKASTRCPDQASTISAIVAPFRSNVDEELQQRAAEYQTMFNQFASIRPALLERMPVAESKLKIDAALAAEAQAAAATAAGVPAPQQSGEGDLLNLLDDGPSAPAVSVPAAASASGMDDLLGLDFGGPSTSAPTATSAPSNDPLMDLMGLSSPAQPTQPSPEVDLLGGLLGSSPSPATTSTTTSAPSLGLDDLLGLGTSTPSQPVQSQPDPLTSLMDLGSSAPVSTPASTPATVQDNTFVGYDADGVRLSFTTKRTGPSTVVVKINASSSLSDEITGFSMQVAVTKTHTVQLSTASGTTLGGFASAETSQVATVNASAGNESAPLKMLVRMTYTQNGQSITKQAQVSSFPSV